MDYCFINIKSLPLRLRYRNRMALRDCKTRPTSVGTHGLCVRKIVRLSTRLPPSKSACYLVKNKKK